MRRNHRRLWHDVGSSLFVAILGASPACFSPKDDDNTHGAGADTTSSEPTSSEASSEADTTQPPTSTSDASTTLGSTTTTASDESTSSTAADASSGSSTGTASSPCVTPYPVGAQTLWSNPTIAFCINGDGASTPSSEALAETLCNAPDWALCSAEDVRERNGDCDYQVLTFAGVVSGGGNNCVLVNTTDQPNVFDCASDLTRSQVAGGCGGAESSEEYSFQEWTEPPGGGVGGALCCAQ